uniref:Uncharacterized protein n=1 Tax=Astatotilapia calliptera TaxID=8154 RepID=A0A3P8QGY9_ASTCA
MVRVGVQLRQTTFRFVHAVTDNGFTGVSFPLRIRVQKHVCIVVTSGTICITCRH